MRVPVGASAIETKSFLTNSGVLFSGYGVVGASKPVERLCLGVTAGEIDLYLLDDGRVCYQTVKACGILLQRRRSGLHMLYEEKRFRNGTIVPPRTDYSMSEKSRFLLGETPQEALLRGIREELQLDTHSIKPTDFVLVGEKRGVLHESVAFPGLWAITHKFVFEWMMPKRFHKQKHTEHCGYRTSVFTPGPVSKEVLRAYEVRKRRAKAA